MTFETLEFVKKEVLATMDYGFANTIFATLKSVSMTSTSVFPPSFDTLNGFWKILR